ncbi:CPBP family intramembrane glutamic endopeptidase [Anaerolinea sp.]|uniref:CPBP family intramembrane glutamic endopeptidase n=1 Tax=Anaerolinea sp. TaxID=1872519 RepID=UPI002625B718|nr:CPBP family intramembrane glutamic endopeptidase [uncultured Anaerolinea sp.]
MKLSTRFWTLLGFTISGLVFLSLSGLLYLRPPDLSLQSLVWALIGLGFSLVMMGILGFELLRRRTVLQTSSSLSAWRVLLLVYVLTPLVLVFPVWLVALGMGVTRFPAAILDIRQVFSLPTPWVWLIQGSLLFLLMLPTLLPLREQGIDVRKPFPSARIAILLGWMMALMTLFCYHLAIRVIGFEPALLPTPEGIQAWAAGILGVIILPISEQLFFRKYLYGALVERFSPSRALWMTAVIFALVQGRPALFLPAFLFSALLQWLINATGDLRMAILAHAFTNLLALVVNWALLL